VLVAACLALAACKTKPPSDFASIFPDHKVSLPSAYPIAVSPELVGTYPPEMKSGAGYFYDEVLEYRVWCHPDKGAAPLNGESDYFFAFAQYEAAEGFAQKRPGSEKVLVLVRQLEWIAEPETGRFIAEKETRVTEWRVDWLAGNKRTPTTIDEFMKHPHEAAQ
jgi:hypothetical protein